MFCAKCGKEIPDNTECDCLKQAEQQQEQPQPQPQQQYQPAPAASTDNKQLFCILSYIGILWLVGMLVEPEKNDPRVKFHVGQGMLLSIIVIALPIVLSIVSFIFGFIPYIGWIFVRLIWIIESLIGIGYIILAIIQIIGITKNEDKPLPVIGKYAFYK